MPEVGAVGLPLTAGTWRGRGQAASAPSASPGRALRAGAAVVSAGDKVLEIIGRFRNGLERSLPTASWMSEEDICKPAVDSSSARERLRAV